LVKKKKKRGILDKSELLTNLIALDTIISNIEEKFDTDLLVIFNLIKKIRYESDLFIPLTIFENRDLGPLENLVVYLKDKLSLSYHEIAVLIKRDDRTVWTSYKKGKKKL